MYTCIYPPTPERGEKACGAVAPPLWSPPLGASSGQTPPLPPAPDLPRPSVNGDFVRDILQNWALAEARKATFGHCGA